MELEQQVVSFKLACELKNLGFKQKSLFYWTCEDNGLSIVTYGHPDWESNPLSAFSVAELGEMLPKGFFTAKGNKFRGWFSDTENPFEWEGSDEFNPIDCTKEADLRARLLIWLVENNYIQL